jgi:CheY-like chemotaxis protein
LTRILVVDDDGALRRLVAAVLKRKGFAVAEASDGAEAVATLEREAFALVVTDLMMPGMGGPELVRHIRAHRPATKILAVSGSSRVSGDAALLGVDAVLKKPFTPPELVVAVVHVLAGEAS